MDIPISIPLSLINSLTLPGSSDWEPDVTGDFGARIWNPDLIQEGRWHHLALVWSRAVLKNSQFSLYIDGQLVHTCKVLISIHIRFNV